MKSNSQIRRDYATEGARRLQSGRLFAQGCCQAEVARRLNVSRQGANRWFHAWRTGGQTALRGAGRTGRKRKLSGHQLCRLEAYLLQRPRAHGYDSELCTLKRIAQLVRKRFGVCYHPARVWKLLGELGWRCQQPERRARQRNEAAIRRWLKHRWPRIKKARQTGRC